MRVQEMVAMRVREAREKANITQEELGERLQPLLGRGWSRQTVSAAEQGKRAFTAAEMVAIAFIVGVRPYQLLRMPYSVVSVSLPGGRQLTQAELEPPAWSDSADERMARQLTDVIDFADSAEDVLTKLREQAAVLRDDLGTDVV